jgi:hypothetical protein
MIDDVMLLRAQNLHLKRQLQVREQECRLLRAQIRDLKPPVPQDKAIRNRHTSQFLHNGAER